MPLPSVSSPPRRANSGSKTPGTAQKRVTMTDVAQKAGVQKACVSVVLNGAKSNAHVSPAARERILEAAQELGYKRNGGMASIASGRFGCVALLLSTHDMLSTLPSKLLDGLYDALAKESVHLSLFRLRDEDLTDQSKMPKILREWMADGMVIDYTHNIPEELVNLIRENDLPAIWLNTKQEFDCVRPDDFRAGLEATEHLLKLGHRHISYVEVFRVRPTQGEHYSVRERCEGYSQAMRAAGLTPQIVRGEGSAYPHLLQLLQNPAQRPTAVIGYGAESEAALGVALRLGLDVPQDLSIISLSHNGGQWANLPLTAYLVPEYEMGQVASAMIQEKISQPQQRLKTRVLPFEILPGATVCPTAKKNS